MKRLAAAAAALALATLPAGLQAQQSDVWRVQVRNQINRVAAMAESYGVPRASQYFEGSLREGRSQDITFKLSGDRDYLFVAACDNDCRDIDLVAYEPDGTIVSADRDANDLPRLRVPRGHDGTHTVRVTMAQCSYAPCRYEVAVFSR